MSSFPFILRQTTLDSNTASVPLIRIMFRQSNRFPAYSFQSLLAGSLDRQGRMDSIRISIPHNLWNLSCAYCELESRKARISLPTNLLSSITLCFTRQLGIILLARYYTSLVSATRDSMEDSICSVRVSMIFKICRETSYYSTLSSSFILFKVSTKQSQRPFSTSQTHIRQYISKMLSFSGSSDTISCSNSIQAMLMSALGWFSNLSIDPSIFDQMISGICSCPDTCRDCKIASIYSSD